MQVQGREGHPLLYSSSYDAARRIFRAEGITAFWRGSLPTYMKVAPSILVVRYGACLSLPALHAVLP